MNKTAKQKAGYVDGFVFVVPQKNVKAYKKMCKEGNEMWMKHGALSYFECMGDDVKPKKGPMKVTSFPEITGQKKGETVWFSFITFKNRKHRDTVNAKVMKEMEKKYADMKDMPMPFDMARMAYGGFRVEEGSN